MESPFQLTSLWMCADIQNNMFQLLDWEETSQDSLKLQEMSIASFGTEPWNLVCVSAGFVSLVISTPVLKRHRKQKNSFQLILEAPKFKNGDRKLEYLTYKPKIESVMPSAIWRLFSRIQKGQDRIQIYSWKKTIFCQLFYDFSGWWRFAVKISTDETAGMIVVVVLQTVKMISYSQTRIMQHSCQREFLYSHFSS